MNITPMNAISRAYQILFINSLSACVRLSDATVPRFNSLAELVRIVEFEKRDSARIVGFAKRDSENGIISVYALQLQLQSFKPINTLPDLHMGTGAATSAQYSIFLMCTQVLDH
jgi:hypothetical protein